jgi:hypothetical protein
MVELVKELSALSTAKEARQALRAFIAERKRHQPRYLAGEGEVAVTRSSSPSRLQPWSRTPRRAAVARKPSSPV